MSEIAKIMFSGKAYTFTFWEKLFNDYMAFRSVFDQYMINDNTVRAFIALHKMPPSLYNGFCRTFAPFYFFMTSFSIIISI